jgi:hypothetical protein
LSIAEAIQAASVTVRAASVEDPSKYAEKVFTIEKNVGLVQNDAAFEAALNSDATLIAIASPINTPSAVTIMSSNKTIDIRSGGKLTVAANFTAKGSVRVGSGGTLEIASGKTLTADRNPATSIVFGNDEITFFPGTYQGFQGRATLSFNAAQQRLTLDGDENAELRIRAQSGGTTASPKLINIPLGYSFMLKKDVGFASSGGNWALDFGSLDDQTQETGLSSIVPREGDALLTASAEGIELRTSAPNGYITSDLYCVPGKSFIFPAPGSGYYPPKLDSFGSFTIEPSSSGGVKLRVTGGTVTRINLSTSGLMNYPSSGVTVALKVERISGGSGTLSFIASNTGTFSNSIMLTYCTASIDLGGTPSDPVGSIILKKHLGGADTLRPNIQLFGGVVQEIKTGNAESGPASLSSAITPEFSGSATTGDLSVKGNGSGKLASISRTASDGSIYLYNSSTTEDFIINAATNVTE